MQISCHESILEKTTLATPSGAATLASSSLASSASLEVKEAAECEAGGGRVGAPSTSDVDAKNQVEEVVFAGGEVKSESLETIASEMPFEESSSTQPEEAVLKRSEPLALEERTTSEKSSRWSLGDSPPSEKTESKSTKTGSDAAQKTSKSVICQEAEALVAQVISKVASLQETEAARSSITEESELSLSRVRKPDAASTPIETVVSEIASTTSDEPAEVKPEGDADDEDVNAVEKTSPVESIPSETTLRTPSLSSDIHSAEVVDALSAKEPTHQASSGSRSGSPSEVYSEDFEDEEFADEQLSSHAKPAALKGPEPYTV